MVLLPTEIVILPTNGVEGLARRALLPARADGAKRRKVVKIDLLAQCSVRAIGKLPRLHCGSKVEPSHSVTTFVICCHDRLA